MRATRYFVVIALALGACGGDDSGSDVEEVERDLARTVAEQTGTRDVEVDCPGESEDELCEVRAPGGVRAKVTRDGKLVAP